MAGGPGARMVWPRSQPVTAAGVPLVGGKLHTYSTATSTPMATYSDSALTVPNTNPVIADEMGFFGDLFLLPASYKIVLVDANDVEIWTADPCGFATPVTDGVRVGTMTAFAGASLPPGYLWCGGQTVSRTVYSALFTEIGTAYGVGNGTTTFGIPDRRGRVSVGKDDLGGVPAGRVTIGGSGINGAQLGAVGGDQLAQQHDHATSADPHNHTVTDPHHAHGPPNSEGNTGLLFWDTISGPGHFLPGVFLPTGLNRGNTSSSATGISVDAATTVTTVDNSLQGASQNMPPCIIDQWIIFAGA